MVVWLDVLVGLLPVGIGAVSDSFACFEDPFSPTGLPRPGLTWGFVLSLTITCHAVFGCCPWETCSFLKVNIGRVDLG